MGARHPWAVIPSRRARRFQSRASITRSAGSVVFAASPRVPLRASPAKRDRRSASPWALFESPAFAGWHSRHTSEKAKLQSWRSRRHIGSPQRKLWVRRQRRKPANAGDIKNCDRKRVADFFRAPLSINIYVGRSAGSLAFPRSPTARAVGYRYVASFAGSGVWPFPIHRLNHFADEFK